MEVRVMELRELMKKLEISEDYIIEAAQKNKYDMQKENVCCSKGA